MFLLFNSISLLKQKECNLLQEYDIQ